MLSSVFLSTATLLVSIVSLTTASPAQALQRHCDDNSTSTPVSLILAPYSFVGCEQSSNPFDHSRPTPATLVPGYCFTAPYDFASYFYNANATTPAAGESCSLALFAEPRCNLTAASSVQHVQWGSFVGCNIPGFGAKSAMIVC